MMGNSIVKLSVLLSANASQATQTLHQFAAQAQSSSMKAKQAFNGQSLRVDASGLSSEAAAVQAKGGSLLSSIGGVRLALSGMVASAGLYAATMSLKLAAANEQATISFETLLKSTAGARKMMDDLQQFAKVTPFSFTDIRAASQQMLSYGIAARDVIPMLRIIGDAASTSPLGMAEGMERVTRAIGQMKGRGKVSAQEMLQLTEAGINAWEMLAKGIGKSVAETMTLVEAGSVNAATGIKALLEGMQKTTGGNMEKQSNTLAGKASNLWDSLKIFGADTGEMAANLFKLGDSIDWLTKKFDKMNDTVRSRKAGFDVTDPIAKLEHAKKMAAGEFMKRHGIKDGTVQDILTADWWKKDIKLAKEMEELVQRNLKALGKLGDTAVNNLSIVQGAISPAVAELQKFRKEIQDDIDSIGMNSDEKKLANLKKQGATLQQLALAQQDLSRKAAAEGRLKLFEDGAKLIEDMRTPFQTLNYEVGRLNSMLKLGAIDWDTYQRAVKRANDTFTDHEPLAKLMASTLEDLRERINRARLTEDEFLQKKLDDVGANSLQKSQVEKLQLMAREAEQRKQLIEDAKRANDAELSGLAKYRAELERVKQLWSTGKLTADARDSLLSKAKKDVLNDFQQKNAITNPGLALAGSQEAYKAMLASTQVKPEKDGLERVVDNMAKETKDQTVVMHQVNNNFKGIADDMRRMREIAESRKATPVAYN
jgi:tape measure domain-containing protein